MKDELLFENNFFVSKSMKQIDSYVGYKEEIEHKLIKSLKDSKKDKTREFNFIQNENKFKLKKQKKEEEIRKRENSKNNTHQLNLISSSYNLQFLPRISPYIKNIENYLIMDPKKADKLGSKGFQYIWKQENLRKLSNIKMNGLLTKKNKSKSKKEIYTNFINNEDDDQLDIFNQNYSREEKKCDEYIKLKERLNRIIKGNKKVSKIFNMQKKSLLRFNVKKIYYPKYESVEKHKPEIRLNNKTKRIFIDDFIKKSYYSDNNKLCSTSINNNNIKGKKFNPTTMKNKRKTFYLCSSLSYDNVFAQKNKVNELNYNDERQIMKLTNANFYNTNKNNSLLGINKID